MAALLVSTLPIALLAQSAPNGPLNNLRIGSLVGMGVSEQEVLRLISTAPSVDFDLRPVSTDALIRAGVSEPIIKAMAAKETGQSMASASPRREAGTGSPTPVPTTSSLPRSGGRSERFQNIEYLHATGDGKRLREDGQLAVDNSMQRLVFESESRDEITIPGNQISRVVYERAAKPRYAAGLLIAWPLLFTKSKQHYLTVQYGSQGQGDYAVFRMSKKNYREILAAVESATGQKVDRQEER